MLALFLTAILVTVSYLSGFLFACNRYLKNSDYTIRELFFGKRTKKQEIKVDIRPRFTDDGNDTLTDLYCEMASENEAEYVEKKRQLQNKAYNYTKKEE